jgi:TonB family protein
MRKLHKLWFLGLVASSACNENNAQREIDRWNAAFAAQKDACIQGRPSACQTACQMTQTPTICTTVAQMVDRSDPQLGAWLDQCPTMVLRDGRPLCEMASAAGLPPSQTALNPPADALRDPLGVKKGELSATTADARTDEATLEQQLINTAIEATEASQTVVRGALPKPVIRRVVARHISQVNACYENRLAANPELVGGVEVKFIIDGKGRVQMAAISKSSISDPVVEQCTVDVIRRMLFPQPEGGGIVIATYPFEFKQKKEKTARRRKRRRSSK